MATTGIGSGLDAQLGIAEEAVWGTIVTPDRFPRFLTETITDAPASLDSPPSLGQGAFPRHDETLTYSMPATGATVMRLTTKGAGKFLRLIFGQLVFTWPGGTNASQVLTFVAQPSNNDTVTIGTTVYTYKTTLTASTTSGEVLIGATLAESIRNLAMAINRGRGEGTWYGSLTPVHPTVVATYDATTLTATDKTASGTTANTVATTETLTNAGNVWGDVTLLGGVDGTDATRLQTYTPSDRLTYGRSATIQVNRPSRDGMDRPFTYAGMKVTSWTLRVSLDGWVELEINWTGKPGVTSTALATASYITTSTYAFTHMAVTVGGVAIPIQSFEITGTWAMQSDTRNLNNTLREPLANGFWTITGTMNAEFTDMTAYTAFLAGTQAALVATLTGGTIPTAASPYLSRITLAAMKYTGSTPTVGGPDVLQQTLPFMVYKNAADPAIKWEYQTDDTAP